MSNVSNINLPVRKGNAGFSLSFSGNKPWKRLRRGWSPVSHRFPARRRGTGALIRRLATGGCGTGHQAGEPTHLWETSCGINGENIKKGTPCRKLFKHRDGAYRRTAWTLSTETSESGWAELSSERRQLRACLATKRAAKRRKHHQALLKETALCAKA